MTDATKTRLWDPEFKYVPASSTDLRVTFARIKAQQQKQQRMHQVKEKSR